MAGKKLPPHRYYVYVIEAVDRMGKTVFYVGQSGKTPAERFREHKSECTRFCSSCGCKHYIRGKVKRLRYELFEQYNPITSRVEAERIERWLARKLRQRGYRVIGGH